MPKKFKNLYPHESHGLRDVLKWKFSGRVPEPGPFAPPTRPSPSLRELGENSAIWIGHSSFAVRIGTKRLLIDPVLSDYCAPFAIKRLKRRVSPSLSLREARHADVVLLTHNHYDHLDWPTLRTLDPNTHFIVPLGLAAWFRSRGRPNVCELDWWESVQIGEILVTSVPAQHFSSRTLWDRDRTLWCGWVVQSETKRFYHAGDTGYCPVFVEIGEKFGPLDFAAIPIGAYEPRWFMKPMHVCPDEAVRIHMDVQSQLSVACHWGTFCLTDEPMSEPPERLGRALQAAKIPANQFRVLEIGETVRF